MIVGTRLAELIRQRRLSQSELARRVGVTQQTVHKLITGASRGSAHLHRIARELQTTPAYLVGEIDDPDDGAPPPVPSPTVQFVMLPVALPSENALARMFEGLLAVLDLSSPPDELARELAQLLPTGLSQLRGRLIETVEAEPQPQAKAAPALANADRERQS